MTDRLPGGSALQHAGVAQPPPLGDQRGVQLLPGQVLPALLLLTGVLVGARWARFCYGVNGRRPDKPPARGEELLITPSSATADNDDENVELIMVIDPDLALRQADLL